MGERLPHRLLSELERCSLSSSGIAPGDSSFPNLVADDGAGSQLDAAFDVVDQLVSVEGFQEYLDEWVFGVKDRTEYVQHYIERLGYAAFKKLQAEFDYAYPVSYTY